MKPQTHSTQPEQNVDLNELSKFDDLAKSWWDKSGDFKPLHEINPLRMAYINERTCLEGQHLLDVGCGGGILSEALAAAGAVVTGIDMAAKPLQVARLHKYESELEIDYQLTSIESYAADHAGQFDVITCMEMLEHVPSPASVIAACERLLKPGGQLFLSTINRNAKAYLLAVLGAEYVLRMLPKGTHDYSRFIKPSELARWLRQSGFALLDVSGMGFNPISRVYKIGRDTDVNYLIYAEKA